MRLPEQHNCEFDHKTHEKKRLDKKLVKVDNEKVIRIGSVR